MEEALKLAATQLFATKQYGECLKTLLALGQLSDYRSRHNELVTKYFKSGCTFHSSVVLLNGLGTLLEEQQKKLEEEFVINTTDSETSESQSNHLKQLNELTSTANYNCAVLNYHLQHYSKAYDILAKLLFNSGDQLEDYLTLKVSMLMIEVCFRMNVLDKRAIQQSLEIIEKATRTGIFLFLNLLINFLSFIYSIGQFKFFISVLKLKSSFYFIYTILFFLSFFLD